ncbi:hypothetical protein GQ42DRAFT_152725 [Ramicandelaber brevisporus]|nr:hypothetical protein GQ42DRAFT_152725 [Ramicandelaber brevisporus]
MSDHHESRRFFASLGILVAAFSGAVGTFAGNIGIHVSYLGLDPSPSLGWGTKFTYFTTLLSAALVIYQFRKLWERNYHLLPNVEHRDEFGMAKLSGKAYEKPLPVHLQPDLSRSHHHHQQQQQQQQLEPQPQPMRDYQQVPVQEITPFDQSFFSATAYSVAGDGATLAYVPLPLTWRDIYEQAITAITPVLPSLLLLVFWCVSIGYYFWHGVLIPWNARCVPSPFLAAANQSAGKFPLDANYYLCINYKMLEFFAPLSLVAWATFVVNTLTTSVRTTMASANVSRMSSTRSRRTVV